MSELRKDPLGERWVVVAPERERRPHPIALHTGTCPFCPGNEALTPREIHAFRPGPGGAPWTVRVFPHRQPALRVEGELAPRAEGIFERLHGIGAHELVVECPQHGVGWADLPEEQLLAVLLCWQERLRDLFRDGRLEHVVIHKHQDRPGQRGPLDEPDHPHSHVIGTPITPRSVEDELRNSLAYHARTRRCALCDVLDQTVATKDRVVAADERVVVLAPWASRFPFELQVVPRRHRHAFGDAGREELVALARALADTCRRLRTALEDPPFDLTIHTAPNPRPVRPHPFPSEPIPLACHWYVELIPRLFPIPGYACATGLHVNPTPPETAAAFLRSLS